MKVPAYTPGTIQETPLPGVRQTGGATAEMFEDPNVRAMGNLGKALMVAGDAGMAMVIDQQKTLNADAVARAEVAQKELETKFRLELENRKGINAANAAADAGKWFDDMQRKHMETLGNDAQRNAFSRLMAERRATMLDFAGRHQAREINNAWAESKNANITASINLIAASGGDEKITAQERNRIEGNLIDIAQRMGWAPEVAAQKRAEALTTLHDRTLQTLMVNDPRRADEYLKKYGEEIAPDKRDDLILKVRKATIEADGRDLSLKTIAMGYNGGLAEINKQVEEAKKMENVGEREARLDMLEKARLFHRQEFAHREEQRNYNQRQAAEQAYTLLRQGKNVPLNLRNAMDPKAAMALEKDMAEGTMAKTDWAAYARLRQEAKDNPEKFAKLDLYKYFGVLGKSERETLLDLQDKVSKPETAKHLQSLESFISGYAADNKLYNSGETREKYWQLENTIKDELRQMAKSKGVPENTLTSDDWQKAADRAVMRGTTPGTLYGTNEVRRFEMRGSAKPFTPAMAETISDVPEKDRLRLREQYKRANGGAMLPDRKLIDLYNTEKKGK